MSEFRKMYTFMVNPILAQAGKDSESRPYSVPRLSQYVRPAEWDMRVCLFAAHSLSPHLSVRIASAYARDSSPQLGSAVRNKRVIVLRDGYLRFYNNSSKPKNDGFGVIHDDLNRAFSEVFEIGISCDSECIDPKDHTTGQVTLSEIVDVVNSKVEQATLANRSSSTTIVVLWSFQLMDLSEGNEKISKPLDVLDGLSRRIANLVLVCPGNPELFELPRSGQTPVQLSNLFEKAWSASVSRTFISVPIEYVLESLTTSRGYKIPYSPANASRIISRLAMIVRIDTRTAVGQLPSEFGPDDMRSLVNVRTPKCVFLRNLRLLRVKETLRGSIFLHWLTEARGRRTHFD